MDTELLVGNRIEDGQQLVTELVSTGFDVSIAFWVKTADEGLWFLYIGSTSAEPSKSGDTYLTVYACLSKIPDSSVDLSAVKLVPALDPIAQDAIAMRDRHAGRLRLPVRLQNTRLGNLSIEEAYIYPRVGGQMTPGEILQALFRMANRPAGTPVRPSVITLRGGNLVTAIVTGFNLQMPGGFTIFTLDPASNARGQIAGDEVINIQA